jgi:multisubunit Na+/H+ antiporter MnhG subunit
VDWWIEIIPYMIIAVGFVALYDVYKKQPCAHDKAEIMSGFGIGLLCAGVIEIAIRIGDILAIVIILCGMFVSLIYGIQHIRARRIERRNLAALKNEVPAEADKK